MVDAVFKHFTSKLIFNSNSSYPILKLDFTSNLFNIIISANESRFLELSFKNVLKFNHLSKILLIFMFPTNFNTVFKLMLDNNYVNVLALEYSEFEDMADYYYYDIAWRNDNCIYKPEIVVCQQLLNSTWRFITKDSKTMQATFNKANTVLFKNKLKNLNLSMIGLLLSNEFPRTQLYNAVETFGYIGRILHTFCDLVNASLTLTPMIFGLNKLKQKQEIFKEASNYFATSFENLVYNKNSTHDVQQMSTVLESMPYLVIVPEPVCLAPHSYLFKPFEPMVWYSVLLLIFVMSFVARGPFWKNFSDVLRAILLQSFRFHSKSWSSSLHMLLVIFGFIMTTLYNALIGSFVTTTLYEKHLNSLEDIEKSGLKILVDDNENLLNSFPNISKFRNVFENVSRTQFFNQSYYFNNRYGYLEYGDRWEYYYKPRMRHVKRNVFRKTDIVVTYFPVQLIIKDDFILKAQFNRFLDIIRDVGLYQHWTRGAFTEAINYKIKGIPKVDFRLNNFNEFYFTDHMRLIDPPRIQALGISFIKYGLLEFGIGLFISGIVFILEYLKIMLKRICV